MQLFHNDHDDVIDDHADNDDDGGDDASDGGDADDADGGDDVIDDPADDGDDDGGDDDVTCRQHVETQYQSTGDKIELLESQVSHSLCHCCQCCHCFIVVNIVTLFVIVAMVGSRQIGSGILTEDLTHVMFDRLLRQYLSQAMSITRCEKMCLCKRFDINLTGCRGQANCRGV